MFTFKKVVLLSALLISFTGVPTVSAADKVAGEQLASNSVGCHGAKGQSTHAQWPNLAAQTQPYIVNQLNAFKSGKRTNSMMQAMASNLSEEDMSNLAAYFASQAPASAGGDTGLATVGQGKAAMCLGCHGSNAQGQGAFPRLAGQHSDYTASQLNNFKVGARKGGPMQGVASSLSEADIKELSAYFGTLK